MATITERFGSGGANVAPGGAAGSPDLATALRDVADDLAALVPGEIETEDAGAVETADLTDVALADAGDTYTTAERDLVNALKAGLAASNALVNELKAAVNAQATLVNELKTALNTGSAVTLKTTKG